MSEALTSEGIDPDGEVQVMRSLLDPAIPENIPACNKKSFTVPESFNVRNIPTFGNPRNP